MWQIVVCLLVVFSISNGQNSYSIGTANRMCQFELVSYCCGYLDSVVSDWTCQACEQYQPQITNVNIVASPSATYKDANGFVAWDPKQSAIIIAFAGTDPASILDWIDDIDTFYTSYPCSGCEVHQGFYTTYQAISGPVWTALEKLWAIYGKSSRVQIVGHSLGGALATFCALDLYTTANIQPQYVYTFGEPRTGNSNFANFYHNSIQQHYRVTHGQDPVPHLPPESFGFEHGPQEIFYANNPNASNPKTNCNGGEDPTCSDQYFVTLDVADHLDYMGYDFTVYHC